MKRLLCFLLPLILLCGGCMKSDPSAPVGECTVTICCTALLNEPALRADKKAFVPSDGYILHETQVDVYDDDTAFDILRRACADNVCADSCGYCQNGGIQLEYEYAPVYGTYYIEGIHNLYEKDAGSTSGWIFLVNGLAASAGCSQTAVHDGDVIEWTFSCG